MYMGFQSFKQANSRLILPKHALIYIQTVLLIAILLAFPESYRTNGHSISYFPSGVISGILSDVIVRMFGQIGSVIVLSVYTISLGILYLPKGFKFKPNLSFLKFKFPKVELDREEQNDDVDGIDESSDIIVIEEKEQELTTQIEPEPKIIKREKRSSGESKKLTSFQKKIPELKPIEKEEPVFIQVEEDKPKINSIENETAQNTVNLDEVLDNITPSESNLSSLFESELTKKEEEIHESHESFLSNINTEKVSDSVDEIKVETTIQDEELLANIVSETGVVVEPIEEKSEAVNEEISFTVEDAIEEKSSNLDKVQKKVGKRRAL